MLIESRRASVLSGACWCVTLDGGIGQSRHLTRNFPDVSTLSVASIGTLGTIDPYVWILKGSSKEKVGI